MMRHFLFSLVALMGFAAQIPAAASAEPPPPAPPLTPDEELAKFVFQEPGYRLEPVVTDPVIKEPVLAVFDGNGRMYVAEMRSYMQDIDGNNELVPAGRVSLHWSSKGDGVFDQHTVFADHLVLPRMILPLAGGVLINETGSDNIWLYRDTNGDGVADSKELFLAGGPRGENLEHQPSGLIWDLDNWLYMAVNPWRLRIKGTNIIGEPTAPNLGQWGLAQDDYGKLWFLNAGWESGPLNFQTPIIYGAFHFNEGYGPGFAEVWPLVNLRDYEGGPPRIRPDGTLNHYTSSCGQEIFRGDRLPVDLRGDLLFAEPVGRLIRRARIEVREAFTRVYNRYDQSEFIRSTDPNFRPVNMVNAPDGTLYIVDMYRGIIQEANWVRPGSYLRPVIQQNQLDKNIGRGRIWRLAHKDFKPGPQPRMLDETPAQLVEHIQHPNGWWRDTAQKLLVLRGDKSVVPALARLAQSSTNRLGRIQALWTLEGLDALDPALLRQDLADPDPQIKIAAIRTSESLYKAGDDSLVPDISALARDPDPSVVLQVLLTASLLRWPGSDTLIASTVATNPAFGIKKMGPQLFQTSLGPAVVTLPPEFTTEERKLLVRGGEIYKQLCFTCHGLDGNGMALQGASVPGATMAPALAGSPKTAGFRDGVINIVLKGLTGPQDGKTYSAQMVPMQGNDDTWIAAVISYIRNNFGNHASIVTPQDVARVRAAFKGRIDPWTLPELLATLPAPLTNRPEWKVSASHNPGSAGLAVDDDLQSRYDTGANQVPGMWFEINLPSETDVAGLELDAGSSEHDFPRGYKVELSSDGSNWGTPVATGHGTGALTEIIFPPARAKFIRITQTDTAPGHDWSIQDLQVLKPSPLPPPPQSVAAKKPANPLE
jgi:mono/diheme cytochrome c family protein/glucose/arabinose dehydrogenase